MVNYRIEHGHLVFVVGDSLNYATIDEFKEKFEAAVEERNITRTVIDANKIVVLDSSVLAMLVHLCQKLADAGGYMYLVNVSQALQQLLDTTHLSRILKTFPTLDDLLNELDRLENLGLR